MQLEGFTYANLEAVRDEISALGKAEGSSQELDISNSVIINQKIQHYGITIVDLYQTSVNQPNLTQINLIQNNYKSKILSFSLVDLIVDLIASHSLSPNAASAR